MAKTSIYAGATQVVTTNRHADAAKAQRAAAKAAERAAAKAAEAAKAAAKAKHHEQAVNDFAIDLTDLTYETVVVLLDAMKSRARAWEILTPTEAAERDAIRKGKKLEPKGRYSGGLAQTAHNKWNWSDAEIRAEYKKRLRLVEMLQAELTAVDKAVDADFAK